VKVKCATNVWKKNSDDTTIYVTLYGQPRDLVGHIGSSIVSKIRQLGLAPSSDGWDFLNFALSVVAADSFVFRDSFFNGWSRQIELEVPVLNVSKWKSCTALLEEMLMFLTGDIWTISFVTSKDDFRLCSTAPFKFYHNRDCACLFSGGMDSLVGLLDLLKEGRKPFLVSQAYPKETGFQGNLLNMLNFDQNKYHFNPNMHPAMLGKGRAGLETSSRGRSIVFIGYAVLVLTALQESGIKAFELFVPENGLISINPPLTMRRIGSLSTRTTHPYYFHLLGKLFNSLGIDVALINPYQYKTKGEMLRECKDLSHLRSLICKTSSCGKWKRKNQQCGRCVPCTIRRAALAEAKISDITEKGYEHEYVLNKGFDDVTAFEIAIKRYLHNPDKLRRWVLGSAPFPMGDAEKNMCVDMVRRGLEEVSKYLYN
jgi:hypothetical protein